MKEKEAEEILKKVRKDIQELLSKSVPKEIGHVELDIDKWGDEDIVLRFFRSGASGYRAEIKFDDYKDGK